MENKIMIRCNKLLLAAGAVALSAGVYSASLSAATASSNARATVIVPMTLTNTAELNFGDVTYSAGGGAGTVTIAPGGGVTTALNAQSLGGATSASTFTITGDNLRIYDVTLPASTTIGNGTDTITVDGFTSSLAGNSGTVGTNNSFNVGATLNFLGTESQGSYLGTFDVSVDYQ